MFITELKTFEVIFIIMFYVVINFIIIRNL